MTQAITTLSTTDLVCSPSLLHFGDAVLMDGLGECGPGCGVLIFSLAGEKFIATLCTHIYTGFKVISEDLSSGERAEGHAAAAAAEDQLEPERNFLEL